jgi:hypothetical protein
MIDANTVTSPVTASEQSMSLEELMFQVTNENKAKDFKY